MDIDLGTAWEAIKVFIATYSLKAAGAIFTLIIGFTIVSWATRLLRNILENRMVDHTLRPFLVSLFNIGFKVLLLLSVAGMFGIQVTSFVALFSALALAVGLALQGNLAHFASGVLVFILKFYRVGDFIRVGDKAGIVREIQIFHTVLEGADKSFIILPNGQVTGQPIQNFTIQGLRRHEFHIGIGPEADVEKVERVIQEILHQTPGLPNSLGFDLLLTELNPGFINLSLRFAVKNEDFWEAYEYVFRKVRERFRPEEIGAPLVHLRSMAPDWPAPSL